MANTYTWVIQQMDCIPQEDGQTDVVITVHWQQNATNGAYIASVYGTVSLTYVAGSPFTPYPDLTQDQVVGWVQDALGPNRCAELTASLDQQISEQIAPTVITPALPWA